MPFEQSWLVEDRVVFIRMWGDMTLEELQASANQSMVVLENIDDTIYLIVDQTEVASVPTQVIEINRFTNPVTSHDKMGRVIMYGMQNKLVKFIASMVVQLTGARIHLLDTRAEAFNTLIKLEPSLKDDLDNLS